MNFLVEIYNNKLLFYSIIGVVCFSIFSFLIIKGIKKEKDEDNSVDYEKIDGENSLFDEVAERSETIITKDNKLDLESMIEKMQKDLDAKASEVVEKFESEQEEKSVISYQELMGNNKSNNLELSKINVESILSEIENEEDIIDELDLTPNISLIEDEINEEVKNEEPVVTSKLNMKEEFVSAIKSGDFEEESSNEKGKFKATEFISPIYGVQDIKIQYPTVQNMKEFKQPARNYNKFELEQTLNMEPLSDEIRRNEDFLKALKEFRKNLE